MFLCYSIKEYNNPLHKGSKMETRNIQLTIEEIRNQQKAENPSMCKDKNLLSEDMCYLCLDVYNEGYFDCPHCGNDMGS